MVFRDSEMKYYHSELHRRSDDKGQLKVKNGPKRKHNKIPLFVGFLWVINSMETYFWTFEVSLRFTGQGNNQHQSDHQL